MQDSGALVSIIFFTALSCFFSEVFAMGEGDELEELKQVNEKAKKIIRNFCWLAAGGGVCVTAWGSIASQNLRTMAIGGAIAIITYNLPSLFIQGMLI